MTNTDHYESRLWRLLEKEKLADLSQFHQSGYCDEVPLYSRESDVNFLSEGKQPANEVLLRFALKFLRSVVAYEEHRREYVAAVTVWSLPTGLLVPHLFVWCDAIRELKAKLSLHGVTTPFGKRLNKRVQSLRFGERFEVLEDTSTIPDASRVFIAPARAPYPGFAVLDTFRQSPTASKRLRLRA
jgi:hypothetical protein